jgi:uncharacterized protein YbjT (DUF2867 family)
MHTADLPVGSLVLVTGVSGFVGSHVALELLKSGYKVRGTSRSPDKANFLKEHAFKDYKDKFDCMTIPNIEVMGAFDEAVKGLPHSNFFFEFSDEISQMWMPYATLLRRSISKV